MKQIVVENTGRLTSRADSSGRTMRLRRQKRNVGYAIAKTTRSRADVEGSDTDIEIIMDRLVYWIVKRLEDAERFTYRPNSGLPMTYGHQRWINSTSYCGVKQYLTSESISP